MEDKLEQNRTSFPTQLKYFIFNFFIFKETLRHSIFKNDCIRKSGANIIFISDLSYANRILLNNVYKFYYKCMYA